MNRTRATGRRGRLTILIVLLTLPVAAAEIDVQKLPPPAPGSVNFDQSIRPIFEASCLRCHGPERPKSHFRLDDREAALKGGDNGVDILPGDSAKSPLIHYVARLVEDMEMPPSGKGEPLSPEQIGLLRAWIDQGASWGETNPPSPSSFSAVPVVGGFAVHGDQAKFREVEGVKQGWRSGFEYFSVEDKIGADKKFSLEGHALFPDNDVRVRLALERNDFGFVRGGFEQWRKYYDDTGGYYRPFAVPIYSLGRDLSLDIGRAWFDVGLTLPRWPQVVLGYEYQFRDGAKSMLEWGTVSDKKIYPAFMEIDEHTHVVKLDVSYDVSEWHLEDSARFEFYEASDLHVDAADYTQGPTPDRTVQTREDFSQVQGANAFRAERKILDWWLVSGGYLFSKLNGSASLNQTTVNAVSAPAVGTFWSADDVVLDRQSQILSFANLFQPATWVDFSLGLQSEWTRQQGSGNVRLDTGDPNLPDTITLYPAIIRSDSDEQKLNEDVAVRFRGIPWTVLFAEGRFVQDRIGLSEQDEPVPGTPADPGATFLLDTDYTNAREDVRGGFDTSPWRWLSFGAHYRWRQSDSDYDNTKTPPTPGYPGFIRARTLAGDETQAKLVLRPRRWLQATLTFQHLTSDYSTTTGPVPGAIGPSSLEAGETRANTYGLGLTVTPIPRLYLATAFTYSETDTTTASNDDPSIVPYRGHTYNLTLNANYALSTSTSLQAAYTFSRADYTENNAADGLPLGVDYTRNALMIGLTRRFTERLSASLRYGFFKYNEPSSGGANNYTANGVFLALAMKLP